MSPALAVLLCAVGLGCNLEGRTSHAARPLQLLSQEPKSAQGLDCDSGDCGFAPNAPLRFKFDRWLNPPTANRQSVSLSTDGTHLGVFLRPDYDVTARVLTMYPDYWLQPDTVYVITLFDADEQQYGNGLRAYDGSSLDKASTFAFRTALQPAALAPPESAASAPCSVVVATFAKAGCTTKNCHSGPSPRMGLSLDSVEGLKATAIGHLAHQTQMGSDMTQKVVTGGRFGAQMPIIDKGRPENSYLIYKVLIGSAVNREMDRLADPGDDLATTGLTPSQIEDARAWFIEFGAMPPDEVGYPDGVSPIEFVTSVQNWIHAGAMCP